MSNIGADPFIGRLGIGRIKSGVVSKGMPVAIANGPGSPAVPVAIKELFAFDSLGRKPIEKAEAGEIVVFAGGVSRRALRGHAPNCGAELWRAQSPRLVPRRHH